jgi:hypothetical protein
MGSPGEETGVGYGIGGVRVTSFMAGTDLERRILKLKHLLYLVR